MSATASGRSLIRSAWRGALDVVFPPQCVACRAWGSYLCAACEAQLEPAEGERCHVCWRPSDVSPCTVCRHEPPAFDAARAVYVYRDPIRAMVHALKYRGVAAVAPLMASPMAYCLLDWGIHADAVVAVPMAASHRRQRGYNQSELLTREIARQTGIPELRRPVERRAGPSQVDQPDLYARRENVRGVFSEGKRPPPKTVLMVDDVYTSGATLDELARVLKAAGAECVYAMTFARES